MLEVVRTNSENKDFIELIKLLDADLAIRDGDEHAFYAQFNKVAAIKHVVVCYKDGIAIGCGAIKTLDDISMEVKRMYTSVHSRGKGVATTILSELEKWAKELGYTFCMLETGNKQPEAIALYLKSGYAVIPNYGQYAGVENSICFSKIL